MKKYLIAGMLSCSLFVTGLFVDTKAEASSLGNEISSIGINYVGVPYKWGGTTPSGFDCSGFINYTFNQAGLTLPRTSADMFNEGQAVSKSDLKKGDLVFFSTYKAGASHVGIYVDNNQFVHAGSSGVEVSSLSNPYWTKVYYGSKRVVQSNEGWVSSNGLWSFYKNDIKQKGWLKSGSVWYYLDGNGVMKTGWLPWGGNWYFLNRSGVMETGWVLTGGKWYYLYSSGEMAKNTTIQGYEIGSDGAWIQ